MKINYEVNTLTISHVSIGLLKEIIQTIEEHEAGNETKQKAEEWRTLAKKDEKARLKEASWEMKDFKDV